MVRHLPAALLAALLAVWQPTGHAAAVSGGELTWRADDRHANVSGPLAEAAALQPALASPQRAGGLLQAELRHTQALGAGLSLQANALLAHERREGGDAADRSRLNELHLAWDGGPWQLSAGKKVLGWDVGYAFRPNDLVQQEERRQLFGQTPEGRPLLQLEHFGADTAWALVAVQPSRWDDAPERQRGPREAALAARVYHRAGGLDLHGFARQGRHTGASLGAALAWVPTDTLELHASWRLLRRHEAWAIALPDGPLATRDPWRPVLQGTAVQALMGAQWTGGPALSLLAEWWHDGQAPSDEDWRQWAGRNTLLRQLAAQPGLRAAAAGNLAWQAARLAAQQLRRDNAYLRLAWQPEAWTLAVDMLFTPADRGRIVSASAQWKGAQWRIDAALRVYGGPDGALLAQLPLRRSALLALTRPF